MLVALDLRLLPADFLGGLLALCFPRLRTSLERGVGLLAIERIDRGLNCLAFGFQRSGQRLLAIFQPGDLAAQSRRGGLAGIALAGDPLSR